MIALVGRSKKYVAFSTLPRLLRRWLRRVFLLFLPTFLLLFARLFFVCRQQTIVWWEHTMVWWQQTMVWWEQTKKISNQRPLKCPLLP